MTAEGVAAIETFEVGVLLEGRFRIERELRREHGRREYLGYDLKGRDLVSILLTPVEQPTASVANDAFLHLGLSPSGRSVVLVRALDPKDYPDRLQDFLAADPQSLPPSTAPSASDFEGLLEPGAVFAKRYRVSSLLGRGGMGAVYLARDFLLDRDVALKLVHPSLLAGTRANEARRRIIEEAKVVSRLRHPNIVLLHEVGEDEGTVYLVFELCVGGNLRAAMATATPDQIERWILQVADALAHSHHAGVLHRDVKPENIVLAADGTVKLLDFGIAKLFLPTEGNATTGIIGTLRYMSPEQLSGRKLDGRSDQYTLAAVAVELWTGEAPRLASPVATAALTDKGMPLRMAKVLKKALEIEPNRRFASMAEFAAALRDSATGSWSAPFYPRLRRSAPLAATIAVLASFAVAAGIISLVRNWSSTHSVHAASGVAVLPMNADLLQGLQAWKDGDTQEASARFSAAAASAPLDGRGFLYAFAVARWLDAEARRLALEGQRLRSSLDPEEQSLLEALTPLLSEPPETDETSRRLAELTARESHSTLVTLAAVEFYLRAGFHEKALLLANDLPPAARERAIARAYMQLGDESSARSALQRCVQSQRMAIDCLAWSARLATNAGKCDEAEGVARQMIARAPNNYQSYAFLALAIFGRSHSTSAARPTVAARTALVPAAWREEARIGSDVMLSLWDAKFDEALAGTADWVAASRRGGPSDDLRSGYPMLVRIRILEELGNLPEARDAAQEFANAASSFVPSDIWDARFQAACARYRLGLTTRADFVDERDRGISRHREGTLLGSKFMQWHHFYASCDAAPDTIEDAARTEPVEAGAPDLFLLEPAVQAALGHYYFRARRPTQARRWLSGAASACGYGDPIATIRSMVELGTTEEQSGNVREACIRYSDVLRYWGDAKPTRTTQEARMRFEAIGCASVTQR